MQTLQKSTKFIDTLLTIGFWWLVVLTAYYSYYYIRFLIFLTSDGFQDGAGTLAGFTVGFLEIHYTHGLPYTREAAIAVNIFELITVTVQMSLYCWAIRILRHILGPMTRGKPFAKTIWADLRKLGWVSLGLCLMDNIMDLGIVLIYEYAYPVRELLESGNIQSVHFRYHFEPAFAIIAAVLFLLSHIFHYGSQLQQLSDETL